jgi:hypothetical protein
MSEHDRFAEAAPARRVLRAVATHTRGLHASLAGERIITLRGAPAHTGAVDADIASSTSARR